MAVPGEGSLSLGVEDSERDFENLLRKLRPGALEDLRYNRTNRAVAADFLGQVPVSAATEETTDAS